MKKLFAFALLALFSVSTWSATYTVAGSSTTILGSSWKEDDSNNDMTLSGATTYRLVKDGLSLSKAENFEFKITKDHSWGTNYPGDNVSATIPAGTKSVIFHFKYYNDANEVSYLLGKCTVVGDAGAVNGSSWTNDAADNKMTTTDGVNFTLTVDDVVLTAKDYQFKIVEFGSWSEYYPLKANGGNASFTITEAGTYKLVYSYNVKTDAITVTKTKKAEAAKFYITGDSALVVDAGFDKSKAWNASAFASNTDSYTIKGLKANVRYQLKVVTSSSEWKGYSDLTGTPAAGLYTYNSGNICFRLSAAGDVVVNYTSTTFTLSGSFKAVEHMTVKFVPGIWSVDEPKYAAWIWGRNGYENWSPFFSGTGDTLSAQINADADSIIFVRCNPKLTEPKWNNEEEKDNVYNEAEKTEIDKVGLTYSITGWGEGEGAKSTGTWKSVANYYVTGDSALVVDGGLDAKKAWAEDAFPSFKDTLVLKNLKANQEYKLKIVAGSDWKGYSDLTSLSSGLSVDEDNNIIFKLTAKGDVTVVYTGEEFKVLGSFVEPEFDPATQQHLKLVPYVWSTANAKIAAFYWGKLIDGGFSNFFTGEGDTLQTAIPIAADSMVLVRFASEVTYPSWDWEDKENPENNKVWNKIDKILIDHKGLVYTIMDWDNGTWESFIPAKYYLTGNSALVVDAGLEADKAWNAQAFKATTDTYVISGLKAGVNYELKVCPEGKLDDDHLGKGYSDLTVKPEGVKSYSDNNICFSLSKAGSVTVTYTESAFTIAGDFYVKQYENKIVKLVPSEEWLDANAKFAAWTWGAEQEGTFSAFFAPISEGNDTLSATIKTSADSIEFVRFSPKASAPTWEQKAETEVLVWNKLKDTIDWKGLTASIEGWDKLTWQPVARPCESFGLLINGVYHAGKKNVMQTEWLEYKLLRVSLKAGDKLQVRNDCADANWVITTYAATSYDHFAIVDGNYVVDADGIYDFYLKLKEEDEIYISRDGFSTQAVPNQCEAVMMQAFFNESYKNDAPGVGAPFNIGNTKWATLLSHAAEISKYFDYVWLPPSANGDGMGYHPKDYGNQNSEWGSASELKTLIGALHAGGAKVVADVVINHCASTYGWMGFPEFNFGKYGKFQPKGSWICANDEVNTDPKSDSQGQATGPNDDGDNWSGARDWAHSNVEVQNMFKAYLQWLREEVGYDGFRYDKGDGFNNWHHDNYNKTAGPEIAFMECYSNTDEIQRRIGEANGNLMALDFDTKWHVFNNFQSWDYTGGYNGTRGNGLLGRLDTKHAVLFIDSHDWFLRGDNENEFGGRGNSLTEPLKARLLAANAYMLSMPGVPCVFYPHWKKYQTEIESLIAARKWAGVHSESWVGYEQIINDGNGYQITVEGKYGYLILCLGTKAHQNFTDDGYKLMASYYAENDQNSGKDGSFQVWVNRCKPILANGYYLVGDKYDWTPVAEHLLVESSTAGEYVLPGIVLETDDSLKVVRVEKDEIVHWYPEGDNYVVDASHAGTKTIYFRPDAPTSWGNNIYIEPNHATFIEETDELPVMKAEKFMKDGKMYIRLGDKVYDALGQTIKK